MVVNGWHLYADRLLRTQLEKLTSAVETAKARDPDNYTGRSDAKLLAALRRLMFETIPADPTRPEYRQGSTLGKEYRHWFRAKFGNGRFRLFFRYDSAAKLIVYAWVNDRDTLRSYGSKSDAYRVFAAMLAKGDPPDDWETLVARVRSERDGLG